MKPALRKAGALMSQTNASTLFAILECNKSVLRNESNHIFHLATFLLANAFLTTFFTVMNGYLQLTVMKENTKPCKVRLIFPGGKEN